MPRFLLPTIVISTLLAGLFFLSKQHNSFQVSASIDTPEAPQPTSVTKENLAKNVIAGNFDLPNQLPLANPPKIIKAAYATSWSASSAAKMKYLIDLIKKTELNALVIDLKDYSGAVTYDIKVPEVVKYGAREVRIPKINNLIKKLHDEGIYVIGRVTVFQDPLLAKARPSLAIKNSATGEIWKDRKNLPWIDPGSMEAWDYIISIVKDAASHGFDEINFDYVRFPSDGDLSLMQYPFTDLKTTPRSRVVRSFFEYLRSHTEGIKISADLFGLTAVNPDDMGIGQIIEYAYENFDYVAPMVYPSHFASGYLNFKNPADHPYEVIESSIESAYRRLITFDNKITLSDSPANGVIATAVAQKPSAKLRPWLQSFDLGAVYDAAKVKDQINAVKDAYCNALQPPKTKTGKLVEAKPCDESLMDDIYGGWMLWDPRNNYIKDSLSTDNS